VTPHNPILPGFHPDPSICRVEDDYYIATSTFEWFPGVALFHSRDLIHWEPVGHALTRRSQLDLIGVPNSGGVWAPCLTHADGRFWLAFTNTRNWGPATMDTPNFLITSPAIEGPWSEPVYLNSSGFDPSLFHDADGRKWLLNMQWDHRPGKNSFAGILLQEYDASAGRLVGPVRNIFRGSALGCTEGPHLYRRGAYYYLLTAEGGTEYGHAVTIARSRSLEGPYELHPDNPILSARDAPQATLQKTGHASLVQTPAGEWRMVFLCGRPLPGTRCCPLGRETAIIACNWTDDGWLQPSEGRTVTQGVVAADSGPDVVEEIRFSEFCVLSPKLQTLRRESSPDWLSLTERPGWLRLVGGESLCSLHRQSLVARRLQHFCARVETCVDFAPANFQQMAGLTAYYDTNAFYALLITHDESLGRCLRLWNGVTLTEPAPAVALPVAGSVWLAVTIDFNSTCFHYSLDGKVWNSLGPDLETACLSDEWAGKLRFTGTMLGLTAQDLSGRGVTADFAYLSYGSLPE